MKRLLCALLALTAGIPSASAALASPALRPTISAAGNSQHLEFSRSGQHLAFVSQANNLVTNDDAGSWLDVFVRDLVTSNTVLVSVSTNGSGGANADAVHATISSNGQIVAFASSASNLAPGITNDHVSQIYIRNLQTAETILASVATNGSPAALHAFNPMLSANGQWVVFESASPDLVPPGNSGPMGRNILARHLSGASNVLVNINADGVGANEGAGERTWSPSITPDGRYVAFLSTATNLPNGLVKPADSDGDVYVRDLQKERTIWVSTNCPAIIPGGYRCSNPALSDDGRFVAFHARAGVVPGQYVLRHDLQTGTTIVLSSSATNEHQGVQISSDGSRVLFQEAADGLARVKVWKAEAGTSVAMQCNAAGDSRNATMTLDGSRVAFVGCSNIYVADVASGETTLVSPGPGGSPSSDRFSLTVPTISPNGAQVVFDHNAGDFVSDDRNGASDIFLHDVPTGETELVTKAQSSLPSTTAFTHSFLGPNSISGDGRFIVTLRYDDPSEPYDTNGLPDVYLHDAVSGVSRSLSLNTNAPSENTNVFIQAIISADGSTVAAVRRDSYGLASILRQDVLWSMGTNGAFANGMELASRSDVHHGPGNGSSFDPSLSADGDSIVFVSLASDLLAGIDDNNHSTDVVLRRRFLNSNGIEAATNYLVSASLEGSVGNGASSNAVISRDGRWVVFQSMAQNLVATPSGGSLNLFARDVWSNATHLIAAPWAASSHQPVISENSRYVPVVYESRFDPAAEEYHVHDLLAPSPPFPFLIALPRRAPSITSNGQLIARLYQGFSGNRIVVADVLHNETEVVSNNPNPWLDPIISADGRYVVFSERTSFNPTILVRDRLLGVTFTLSANQHGRPANGPCSRPVLAADGRTVVFQSFASDIVPADYNDKRDILVVKLGSPDSDGDGMDDDWEVAYFSNLSRDGAGDFDGDGTTDRGEFLAGTDPTDEGSVFRVLTITALESGSKQVLWTGNPQRSYRVEFKESLATADWLALTGAPSWNGTTASLTDPAAAGGTNRFYRVVRLP